jgi:hypothetical protein
MVFRMGFGYRQVRKGLVRFAKKYMKKTVQIDYNDWDIDTIIAKKLREMEIIDCDEYGSSIKIKKTGTLIIEFIEE